MQTTNKSKARQNLKSMTQQLDYQVINLNRPTSHRLRFKVHLATKEGYQSANPREEEMILPINMIPTLHSRKEENFSHKTSRNRH